MKRFFRVTFYAVGLAFLMIATNNCSSTGSGFTSLSGFCSGTCANATAAAPSVYLSNQGFVITKNYSYFGACANTAVNSGSINCGGRYQPSEFLYTQLLQVSGMCSTGGAAANQISIAVVESGVTHNSDINGIPYSNYTTTCDSGRFNLTITPPTSATLYVPNATCAANCAAAYGAACSAAQSLTFNCGQTSAAVQLVVTLKTGANVASLAQASQFATTFYVNF